jgi:hypothetical protein
MKVIVTGILMTATLLASAVGAFAAALFLQASSTEEQLTTDTRPHVVTMNSTDAEKGISNNNGAVTVSEDGAYFVVAAGQVGGKVKGSVRIWMRANGKDVDNSNTEQLIADPAFTTVLVCQGVMELKKGDKVEVMYSGSAPGLGLIAKKPPGEPVVTSIIFSAFKIN